MSGKSRASNNTVELRSDGGKGYHPVHVFKQEDLDAIEAALKAERPLLVRGEPGVGKTQLALAAAIKLKRAYCQTVVDSRTEVRDLRWTEDLVARLADAQLMAAPAAAEEAGLKRSDLAIENYVEPGPLWWAFDWGNASKQKRAMPPHQPHPDCDAENGVVVLIDEIDKADPDLPNGLLEALGSRRFTPPWRREPVIARVWPLVVVTTNENRALPSAFIRRCVVHDITPIEQESDPQAFLFGRGRAHFPEAPEDVLKLAVLMTMEDRHAAASRRLMPLPGQAEFIDLLRAVLAEARDPEAAEHHMNRMRPYFLHKHPELRR